MSIRNRLFGSIVLVLLASVALGSFVAGRHATRSVRTELAAALAVGGQAVRNSVADLDSAADPTRQLVLLIKTFDGNRHVRASLLDATGKVAMESQLYPPPVALPRWFLWLIAPTPETSVVSLPGITNYRSILLRTDPLNEASEVWIEGSDTLLALLVFCLLAALLLDRTIARALRPLGSLETAFAALGGGDYDVRSPVCGATEFRRLALQFNHMADRLSAMDTQNRRLHAQLLTLREAERAELARDLHDEVGPFLFAARAHAAAIGHLSDGMDAIVTHGQAINETLSHAQRHVRAILGRLRPTAPPDVGLSQAIEALVAFWRCRAPKTGFQVAVKETGIGVAQRRTAYRVVQESLSNAIRHGRPARIDILVQTTADGVCVRIQDDGGDAPFHEDGFDTGFGIAGMRERVVSLGGTLEAGPRGDGWVVTATLPLEAALVP
jgi:two-component system sensor histidine kinase UhpB